VSLVYIENPFSTEPAHESTVSLPTLTYGAISERESNGPPHSMLGGPAEMNRCIPFPRRRSELENISAEDR
jgi:hypothetical protein